MTHPNTTQPNTVRYTQRVNPLQSKPVIIRSQPLVRQPITQNNVQAPLVYNSQNASFVPHCQQPSHPQVQSHQPAHPQTVRFTSRQMMPPVSTSNIRSEFHTVRVQPRSSVGQCLESTTIIRNPRENSLLRFQQPSQPQSAANDAIPVLEFGKASNYDLQSRTLEYEGGPSISRIPGDSCDLLPVAMGGIMDLNRESLVLNCVKGPFVGRFLNLVGDLPEVFGSDPLCEKVTTCVELPSLSPLHTEIRFDPRRQAYRIRDLGSETGTYIYLRKDRKVELVPGSEFYIPTSEGGHTVDPESKEGYSVLAIEEGDLIGEADFQRELLACFGLTGLRQCIPDMTFCSLDDLRGFQTGERHLSHCPWFFNLNRHEQAEFKAAIPKLSTIFSDCQSQPRKLRIREAGTNLTVCEASIRGCLVSIGSNLDDSNKPASSGAFFLFHPQYPTATHHLKITYIKGKYYAHLLQEPRQKMQTGDLSARIHRGIGGSAQIDFKELAQSSSHNSHNHHEPENLDQTIRLPSLERSDGRQRMLAEADAEDSQLTIAKILPPDLLESRVLLRLYNHQHMLQSSDMIKIGNLEFLATRLHLGGYETQGPYRASMEDEMVVLPDFAVGNHLSSSFYAIYDGHGGKDCASYLKTHLHLHLLSLLNTHDLDQCRDVHGTVIRALHDTFSKVDAEFSSYVKDTDGKTFCGAAAVVVLILGNMLYVANCGDARCVLSSSGTAVLCSRDHKADLEVDRIQSEGGWVAGGRVNGILSVSRAFGNVSQKEERPRLIVASPEIHVAELKEEDEFFILACDGLWDVFTSQEAVDFVKTTVEAARSQEEEVNLNKVAKALVDKAVLEKHTKDNVTCLIILL